MNIFFLIGLIMAIWKIYEFATKQKENKTSSSPRYQLQDFLDSWDDDWDEKNDGSHPTPNQINNSFVQDQIQSKVVEPSFKSDSPRVSERLHSPSMNQVQTNQHSQPSSKRKPKLSPSKVKKAFVFREVLGAPRAMNPYTPKKFPR